ncbi:UNVERIFIED_CONTAM: hypothetical protein NCL1_47985 [Trichonephila clavipes]
MRPWARAQLTNALNVADHIGNKRKVSKLFSGYFYKVLQHYSKLLDSEYKKRWRAGRLIQKEKKPLREG